MNRWALPARGSFGVLWANSGFPFPHNCVRFFEPGDPHELLDAWWGHTTPVPHLRFALVDVDVCVAPELLPENSFHCNDLARTADDSHVVKESEHLLVAAETPLDRFQCGVPPKREQQWHEGVALLPSLTLWDLLDVSNFILPASASTAFRRNKWVKWTNGSI